MLILSLTIIVFFYFEISWFYYIPFYFLIKIFEFKGLVLSLIFGAIHFNIEMIDKSYFFLILLIIYFFKRFENKINKYIKIIAEPLLVNLAFFKNPILENNIDYIDFAISFSILLFMTVFVYFNKKKYIEKINQQKELFHFKSLATYKKLGQRLIKDFNLEEAYKKLIDIGCKELKVDKGFLLLNNDKYYKVKGKKNIKSSIDIITKCGFVDEIVNSKNKNKIYNKDHIEKLKKNNFTVSNLLVEEDYETFITINVFENKKIIATMFFLSEKKDYFTKGDELFLEGLASHVPLMFQKASTFEKLEKNNNKLKRLQKAGKKLNSTIKYDETLEVVKKVFVDFLDKEDNLFMFYYKRMEERDEALSLESQQNFRYRANESVKIDMKMIVLQCAKRGEILSFNNYFCKESLEHLLLIPIKLQNKIIGVIVTNQEEEVELEKMNLSLINTLANQIAVALENSIMYNKMKNKAIKDGLTQLYNHSYFQEFLTKEVNRSLRTKSSLSILLMDIDNFKHFNDTYGHQAGDEVLRELARTLENNAREYDLVARYGGEEFVVVLPETDEEKAISIGQRFNKVIREMEVKYNDLTLNITASIGATTYKSEFSKEQFIEIADEALYKAKENGKDQTVFLNESLD